MPLHSETSRAGDETRPAARIVVAVRGEFEAEMLLRALQRCGYSVEIAEDADAAVLAILASVPDAIIVSEDLAPPRREALLRWLRRTPGLRGLPVVTLCGHADPEHAVREYDAGADLVVFKPVDPDLLGRELAAVIRRGADVRQGA